jgi:CRP/FNR family cyclic AMP-dependent transcriptional regulator
MSLFEPVALGGTRGRPLATSGHVAPLVDVDPDLARFLPPARRRRARSDIPVRIITLPRGPWAVDSMAVNEMHVGVLVVDGMLGRELLADDVASMELLGPGDLLRPWDESAPSDLLEAAVRWSALAETRVAILDRHVAVRLAAYPEIHLALLERWAARSRRLGILQTIAQLNRVDRRVLALFWHLAEQWGRVTREGVVLPLALSHRMVGQLVGARRPTVSTALTSLIRSGQVARREDGTWVLTGRPIGAPDPRAARSVSPRRAMLPASSQPLPV